LTSSPLTEFIRELIVEGTREGLDAAARGARSALAMTAKRIRHARGLLTRHSRRTRVKLALVPSLVEVANIYAPFGTSPGRSGPLRGQCG
jgi:hypothetical protein